MIRWASLLLVALCWPMWMNAQTPPAGQPEITFRFEHAVPGVAVPKYSITLRGDGTGTYQAEALIGQSTQKQMVERSLTISQSTVKNAFDAVRLLRAENIPCASAAKHVADTGAKTLQYRDAEGQGDCSYNFSENKGVVQLTNLFMAIEETLEEGRALDFKRRFDRLGLDAQMSVLVSAVQEGRAVELGNIAPTLRSIAADPELIQRVRLQAARLLEMAQPTS